MTAIDRGPMARDAQSAAVTWRPQRFTESGGDVNDPLIEPLWTGVRVLAHVDAAAPVATFRDRDGDVIEEFPDVAAFNEENYHVVPGKTLKQGIQRTLFAADVESTRYALGGVLMELRPQQMTLAATDSRRLAVYRAPCSAQGSVSEEVGTPVIPSKAMQLIEKSIQDLEKDVHIAIHHNDVLVRSGNSSRTDSRVRLSSTGDNRSRNWSRFL